MIYDAIVIGGGAVGCATARELSRYDLRLALCEKNEDVCAGTSKANSAICHAGFDAPVGSAKARFNVEGSRMMEELSQQLDFPYRRCGALVLCFDETDIPRLEELKSRGERNGVEGLVVLNREALRRQEPRVAPEAVAALYAPTSAIICPFGMTIALAENAAANGCDFRFNTEVWHIRREDGHFLLETSQGVLESRVVIAAAGVHGDTLHNQLCETKLTIVPRRGEYCLLDRRDGELVQHTIFQLPSAMGKGVLVSPTVHGNLLVGPTAEDQTDRDCTATTAAGLRRVTETAARSVPNLPMRDVITSFAGLRAHLVDGDDDFIVGESADGFFEAVGIESPGLSSAPAIGQYLAELAAEKLGAAEKDDFLPERQDIPRPREMDLAARQALIEKDPAYASVVCRCEQITEGEIREAIRRGARSLDGVKRRVRAGMGRCQGGFCTPRVMEILSRELGIPQTELTKNGGASRLLAGRTKEEA